MYIHIYMYIYTRKCSAHENVTVRTYLGKTLLKYRKKKKTKVDWKNVGGRKVSVYVQSFIRSFVRPFVRSSIRRGRMLIIDSAKLITS